MEPSEEELRYVEDVAIVLERMGLVRMSGRVIGWLLICDPPGQTAGQITAALGASKGAVSGALKFLTTARWIERYSVPGDRRGHFRIRAGYWATIARRQASQYQTVADLSEQGLRLLAGSSDERRERLREMHAFFTWIAKEMPALWVRWERERGVEP